MRAAALVFAGVLAACGDGGVDVEIIVPSDLVLDRVELWIAYSHCPPTECADGVAWTTGARVPGEIKLLRDEQVIRAEPRGDRWVLRLQAEVGYAEPKAIAVVGLVGAEVRAVKVLRSVHIPRTTDAIWEVHLHRAVPAVTDMTIPADPTSNLYRGHVWQRVPTADVPEPTGCLAYQKWSADEHEWQVEYFVPKTDPDCDGQPEALECNAFWHNFQNDSAGNCVALRPLDRPSCQLGAFACSDGFGGDRTCGPDRISTPATTCMPDHLCKQCGASVPADSCIAGAVDAGMSMGMPHYSCGVPVRDSISSCFVYFNFELPRPASPCKGVLLHYIDKPFQPQSQLQFSAIDGVATLAASIQTVNLPQCIVDVEWIDGPRAALAGVTFLVEALYENGNSALYPVTLELSSGTTTICQGTGGTASIGCTPHGTPDGVTVCGDLP